MKHYRRYLAILLLLSNWLTASETAWAGFVKTKGKQFELDGKSFPFQGTNFYSFGLLDDKSEQEVYSIAKQYASKGIRVIRFWGFSCRDSFGGTPLIQGFDNGKVLYNEDAWRRLDLAFDAARAAGLRVIVPLINFEPDLCGMEWWVQQITGSSDKHLFYTDDRVRNAFKSHINTFASRINTRYEKTLGRRVAYKDDATIMAIELANEPHTKDNYERNRGMTPGDLVYKWLKEMSDHIRSKAPNHLISTGEEGYKTSHKGDMSRHAWIHNGSKGVDFARNITLPNISFVVVHIYPDNWQISSKEFEWVRKEIVHDRAKLAHAAGKPIVLEEAGFARSGRFGSMGYSGDAAYWLGKMFQAANEAGYAGTMVWQALPQGHGGSDYDFDFDDAEFGVVQKQVKDIGSGSPLGGSCTNIPPDNRFTCEEQAGWGKCSLDWMKNFCKQSCGRC